MLNWSSISADTEGAENEKASISAGLSFEVAGVGLEPTAFGLWARRATNCSTPQYHQFISEMRCKDSFQGWISQINNQFLLIFIFQWIYICFWTFPNLTFCKEQKVSFIVFLISIFVEILNIEWKIGLKTYITNW